MLKLATSSRYTIFCNDLQPPEKVAIGLIEVRLVQIRNRLKCFTEIVGVWHDI